MDKLVIIGGQKLSGKVKVSGAKNAALPILAATLLTDKEVILNNIPDLVDVDLMLGLLSILGKEIKREGKKVIILACKEGCYEAPYELVNQMRASIVVAGALLGKIGKAKVSLPGGCAIGARPVDLHLKGFENLGAKIILEEGYVNAASPDGLKGAEICLDFPSVGATENLIMASVLASGKTIINGCAKEPEIVDLANFLESLGAKISSAGTDRIEVRGVKALRGGEYTIISDRIEAGTYLVAGAITGSSITVKGADRGHLTALINKLKEAGVNVEEGSREIRVSPAGQILPVNIKTMPYPGFPTDMQAQMMALASLASGESVIMETVFENRFMHVDELNRMGADIKIEGHSAFIKGVSSLSGARVKATDLRAGAALVLAGLAASGTTEISELCHLDRGYERIVEKLVGLGARVERVKGEEDAS